MLCYLLPEKMMARGTQVSPHQLTDPTAASLLFTSLVFTEGNAHGKGSIIGGASGRGCWFLLAIGGL